uniref:Cell division protein FtsA n=1 Tax=uncultured Alphaproteobacteria bacterium TaxID=91750 RepID=A0A6G8F1U2_9PROT|nr:cell division protein FtsA [uncultured Alphaproteobacteria bacterium]
MNSFNRQTLIAALDIGSSKVSCVIARVSRDQKITIAGYGYNASKGIKNGMITDIKQATYSVCDAVEAAEQMANERVERIIVNISGDKVKSHIKRAAISLNKSKPITEVEIKKVIEKGINKINVENNELIHCLPTGYRLDFGEETGDPRNLFGENLSVDVLLGMVPEIMFRNIKTVLDNSNLEIAEKVLSAYSSGLACLVDDEKELGATVIDIGGGTTSIASFKHGHPVYFSSIGVGGNNVTNDIAWGLTTSFAHAERLKTLHGCAFLTSKDQNETINVYPVGEEDDSLIKQVPKSELIGIIAPRIEEMFELVNNKLAEEGLKDVTSHRIVLTGGGSQLSGIREVAAMILDKQVRLGRPRNIGNILDISEYPVLQYPSFSTVIGQLLFVLNYTERKPNKIISKPINNDGSRFNRIMNWLKQNF